MPRKINWQLISGLERHRCIDKVQDMINRHDGFILKHQMFSDLQMSMMIEIRESEIISLLEVLTTLGNLSINDVEKPSTGNNKNTYIFLTISFIRGKGKLQNKIPEIPG